jgi:chemotaxis protein methyltransferase CheR
MTLSISQLEFILLRDLIHEQCGVLLNDSKTYLVEARLAPLVKESGCTTFGEFYVKAKSPAAGRRLLRLMVDAITTNETYWFRDQYPYQILRQKILPELDKRMKEAKRSRINIWSAACSSGQEPYSIAMTILEFYRNSSRDAACHNWVRILATDISGSTLTSAVEGTYDKVSINRGLEPMYLDRYFHGNGNTWTVDDRVRKMVTFQPHDLRNPMPRSESFDVIFLRNVMIYFDDALKRKLFQMMANVLAPNGYLFLGTGETVNGYTTGFEILEWQKAAFYRRKQPAAL